MSSGLSTKGTRITPEIRLGKILGGGRFSHACLFAGPAGTGKKTLAKLAAKTILCESAEDKPCNACISCKSVESGNHPDIIYIYPDKKTTISADYIRCHVVNAASVKPYRSDFKVFIIDKADWMGAASQNILLKTLEEPPSYGIFLLCAENEGLLLPTVMSRLVMIKTVALPPEEAAVLLRGNKPELSYEEALFYANLSGGSVGLALNLSEPGEDGSEPEAKRMRGVLTGLLSGIMSKATADILLETKKLEEYKDSADLLLDIMGMYYRDMAVRAINDGNKDFSVDTGINMHFIEKARERLRANTGFLLTFEILMLNLARKTVITR